ncbi:MAG: DUF6489 family protein [Alphaproteobacteria bacterium]
MKITFNIDCTPVEARSFFGLPDVAPMQKRMLQEMESRMRKNMGGLDMEALYKGFMTGSGSSIERWQEMFRNSLRSGETSS